LLLAVMLVVYANLAFATGDYVPGEVLVQYKSSVSTSMRNISRGHLRAGMKQRFSKFRVEQWNLPKGVSVELAVQQLETDPNVMFAEPNYRRYPHVIPNDPKLGQQWAFQNTGQTINSPDLVVVGTAGADMGLFAAWNTTTGSANVIVAVIDDSVDINHADLYANIWTNKGEIAGNGIDDDGNGYIDDVHGWDFRKNDNDPSADTGLAVGQEEGHGTAVAGCIGAMGNNGIGVVGVNWNVQIMPLKFSNDVATELAAMQYAINNGAHIVNASWGGAQFSHAESGGIQLLQNAGILLIAAAGNSDTNNDIVADYPSGLLNPNILSVAASDYNDTLATFSHYGPTSVDIAAPGVDIYTTMSPYGSLHFGDSYTAGLRYDYTSGTSFSAPYVAGIAALIKAQNPAATFQEMKGRILAGAKPQPSMRGFFAVSGIANAANAVALTVPQPVLVIRDVTWNDGASGNANGWPDPGETISFDVSLENVWGAATGISAIITPLSANWRASTASTTYPNLLTDAYANSNIPFSMTIDAYATGHQVYQFRLDITAAGGYAVSRFYQMGLGNLQKASVYNGTLMATPYDDFQVFHVDVPAGASNVTMTTTSGQNVDLLVNPLHPPQFDYQNYAQGGVDAYTQASVGATGAETISFPLSTGAGYYVTVIDATKSGLAGQVNNYPYTVLVNYTLPNNTAVITIPGRTQSVQVVAALGTVDSAAVTVASNTPAGITVIDGLINYTVRVPTVGATVTTTLTLSQVVPSNAVLYKVDLAGVYTLIPSSRWSINANGSVSLQLTDGGTYDLDGLPNGVIVDPVVVAIPAPAASVAAASGGKGGCSIDVRGIGENHIVDPTLPMLVLFSVMFVIRRKLGLG
ncbi:MAG: S8 family peptidase, partial [Mariprofundaceae bacterium]|nr:S8 family peptidase [Mariprofundaceae bacterium]